jgi:site-specific recombinase XerD
MRDVTIKHLDAFFSDRARSMQAIGLRAVLSAVRSFLRYLYLRRRITTDLSRSLLSPSRFRFDVRPKYIPWHKIQQFLETIDRSTPIGKRNYAVLVLLAYHGLRLRELAGLTLSDIDWENECLLLKETKNGSTVQRPMSQRAKEAMKDYLSVRRRCSAPQIFLTEQAAVKPLGISLGRIAQRRLRRHFGNLLPRYGAYVLRHSFAKALLDRGAPIAAIGKLLGHERLTSTLIYTRVATEDLREVSDNYADLLPPPSDTPESSLPDSGLDHR